MTNIRHLEMQCIEDVPDFLDEYDLWKNRKIQVKLIFSRNTKSYINYDLRTGNEIVPDEYLLKLVEHARVSILNEYKKKC